MTLHIYHAVVDAGGRVLSVGGTAEIAAKTALEKGAQVIDVFAETPFEAQKKAESAAAHR